MKVINHLIDKEFIGVFISQPFENKTEEQINNITKEAIDIVKNIFNENDRDFLLFYTNCNSDGYYNAFNKDRWQSAGCGIKMLSDSLFRLSQSKYAVFCPGWEKSRGCVIEKECCEKFGIEIIILEED